MTPQTRPVRFTSLESVSSLVDHLGAELLGLLKTAAGELGRASGLSPLAGDSPALRSAASAWRQHAGELRRLKSQLSSEVQDLVNGSWQGKASQDFARQWRAMSTRLEDLAAGHDRVADCLEHAAERSTALNSQAAALAHEVSALVSTLESGGDLSAAGQGWDLLGRKDDLKRQIEASWAAYAGTLLAINLFFQHLLQQAHPVQAQQVVVSHWDSRPALVFGPRLGLDGEVRPEATPGGQGGGEVGVMPTNPAADASWIIAAIIAAAAVMAAEGAIEAGAFSKLLEGLTSGSGPAGVLTRAEDSSGTDGSEKGRRDRAHGSYDRAREAAQGEVRDRLGENPERMYDPETGTIVGEQSADGKAGWRADKGHFNWWDWTAGKKGRGGRYGHDYFPENHTGPHSKYPGDLPWGQA
jgi:WXG100 family type VII secretion target